MDAATYLTALRVERQSLVERGLPTADVDAEIARVAGPKKSATEIESKVAPVAERAVRPRKS